MNKIRKLIEKWIEKAEHDLKFAKFGLEEEEKFNDIICFHCQQSAEKYLKALLIYFDIEVVKTHSLTYLLGLLKEKIFIDKEIFEFVDILEEYAVEVRYPCDFPEPSDRQTKEAYQFAIYIKDFVLEKMYIYSIRLYNTLTHKIEEFVPIESGKVRMYTCGPTVYHYAHIGNLRAYIFEDILEKSLTYLGYEVMRAMNITDVGHMDSDADEGEDKMLKGAKRENKTVLEIAEMYTQAFFTDCEKLNINRPEIVAKATEMISEYIEMIAVLEKKGYTYFSNGNVYFDIAKLEDYTKLTNQKLEDLQVAVRDDVEEDKFKKNPLDFGLWFTKSKFDTQELKWDSPWGVGYPGWHIECSAIAIKFLGEYMDIHCGGVDNIFPHHTNEIAQSESYLGHKWVNYWMHGEHLNDETGKMSKSKGEFLTVSLLEDKGYSALDYRFFVLQSHYRKQLVFSYEVLDGAKSALYKLKNKIQEILKDVIEQNVEQENVKSYIEKLKNHIADDLNTANMITLIFDIIKDESLNNVEKIYLINEIDKVLSLDLLTLDIKKISDEERSEIESLIEKRNEAKENKNYELADQIRIDLINMGVMIKDTREGTVWEKG